MRPVAGHTSLLLYSVRSLNYTLLFLVMQARRMYSMASCSRCWQLLCQGFGVFALASALAADNPFAENIRKAGPLTPAQEQKTFHLPPGFEVQLVAAEPAIGKPMNMAFDAQGRLWLTQSREYPFAAPTNAPGRDKISVLSDFAPDGRARSITTFAEGLNLPIGLLPYRDGVIAFSIPNIYYFADTNADGRADTKDYVIGSIGFDRDTHGLTSAFRRGYDGWIYADHGFNNNSTLRATDGSSITMNSGNTYRFQPDGSRVEQFSWGQVNPFGLMFDPLGDLWSADCHSQPVYQLLRGAYYPSFGKPHDGLGFAPNICEHSHGSTAIAGLVYYAATNFPAEYRNNTFIGNVMTCRINRDSYIEHGSTRIAKEAPDFLVCDDPWFRPVDLQLGPDGALYVADFYNRIIGHYEVPLDHPGRDRERGRIWRIVYTGENNSVPPPPALPTDVNGLITELGNPNLIRRMFAMNELVDRIGQPAVASVEKMMRDKNSSANQKAHGLWVLHRLGALDLKILTAAAHDPDRNVRVHALRVLSESAPETGILDEPRQQLMLAGLRDRDAYVQRAAADALGQHTHGTEHGDYEAIDRLLELRRQIPAADAQLMHVCRMALRNQLRSPGAFPHLETLNLNDSDSTAVADIALGVPGEEPAAFLVEHIQKHAASRERLMNYLRHAARYAPVGRLDALADIARAKFADDVDTQFMLFNSVQDGLAQRGAALSPGLRAWALELAEKFLKPVDESQMPWTSVPFKNASVAGNPWFLQKRPSADGNDTALFFSSLPPGGESLTGILRSRPFTIPASLTFFLAGHDGTPDKPPMKKNVIRLLDAGSRTVLARAVPPRNDTAQRVTWDLAAHAGQQGILEIVDGNNGHSFAWLAAGRFDPLIAPLPETVPSQSGQRQQNAAELVRSVPLPQLAPQMEKMFGDHDNATEVRIAAAQSLLALNQQTFMPLLVGSLTPANNETEAFREKTALVLAEVNSAAAREAVTEVLVTAPTRLQVKLAISLAANATGAEALFKLAEQGKISPQVLMDRAVKEKMAAAKLPQFEERFTKLTSGQPSVSAELQKLMDERRAGFAGAEVSVERGRVVFDKTCIVCHQLDGKGAVVGPQLEGVGNRGVERIIEDILDPSRNIDPAFRPSLVTLKDETSITGLLRREEGEVLVFADSTGKEITVPKKEIVERHGSQLSLMPSNFGEVLTAGEFYDLLAFLAAHGTK